MTSEKSTTTKVDYRALIAIFLFAVVIRVIWVWCRPYPLTADPLDYLALARNLAFNHTFTLDITRDTAFHMTSRAPLYPALIAALWWGKAEPLALIKIVQVLMGSVTAALVYLIARDRFSSRIAIVAGVGMAVAPMSSLFAGAILADTFYIFLLTLAFFFWGRKVPALAGVAFGLAGLAKPTITPFLILLVFLGLLKPWRPQWRSYLLMTAIAVAIITPWIIRNSLITGRPSLVASEGVGQMILYGTIESPYDDPWTAVNNHPLVKIDADSEDRLALDRARVGRGLNHIKEHPAEWLRVRLTNQIPRLFIYDGSHVFDFHHVQFGDAIRNPRRFVLLLVANKFVFVFGNILLFGFAAYGMILERARFVELSHITLFPIVLILSYLPLWTETRHSLPMMPLVAILAAVGLLHSLGYLRRWT